jgi:hypothetical protein
MVNTRLYNPSCHNSTNGIKNFAKENFDVAKQLIKGKLQVGQYNFNFKNDEVTIVEIDAERYGDCACHGSRFTFEGYIIEGSSLSEFSFLFHHTFQVQT